MKGIILAGGSGTRLYPLTISISKQLLPIYDKPMIYYPLSVLLLAGIRDILIITTPYDKKLFNKLLGDGSLIGCSIKYQVQYYPNGLAQAFIIAEQFIDTYSVVLILGDNIFYGSDLTKMLESKLNPFGGIIFAYHVMDPQNYGVVEFNSHYQVISLEEKPLSPKSNFIITGLYFYDNQVINFAKKILPSVRGELEITDINKIYLQQSQLEVIILNREIFWIDTGNIDALEKASEFVKDIEKKQGFKVGCIEEIAYRKGFINKFKLMKSIHKYKNTNYGLYLNSLI